VLNRLHKIAFIAPLATSLLNSVRAVATQTDVVVGSAAELQSAVADANSAGGNRRILLKDGTYTLSNTLYVNVPYVTIAGQSGARDKVVIQGDAMSATATVQNVIRAAGSNFELTDVTLQKSGWHLVQVVGETGANNAVIHNCILRDAYQQMVKVTYDPANPSVVANNGLIENCLFEYTAGIGPNYYIGGVDAHGARNWVVRGNTFRHIASPAGSVAEFAVHFWNGATDNIVERNLIVDCDRGIGMGLDGTDKAPALRGIIRNNVVYHSANSDPFADVGIALSDSIDTQVYNNTVFLENSITWALEYRFAITTGAQFTNNLSNKPILARDGATGTLTANVVNAAASWFVNVGTGDLHLASAVSSVVGKGVAVAGLTDDYDGQSRTGAIDIGADQFKSVVTPLPPSNLTVR
jgi:Right handed beta helix region